MSGQGSELKVISILEFILFSQDLYINIPWLALMINIKGRMLIRTSNSTFRVFNLIIVQPIMIIMIIMNRWRGFTQRYLHYIKSIEGQKKNDGLSIQIRSGVAKVSPIECVQCDLITNLHIAISHPYRNNNAVWSSDRQTETVRATTLSQRQLSSKRIADII